MTSQPAAQGKNTLTLQPEVVNHYLQQENTQAMKLSLTGEQLQIVQYSDFLSQKIKTNILTTPVVIGHNKLRLDINDVAVAGLPLSKKQTLNLIRRFGSLPDNVVLDVNKECFTMIWHPLNWVELPWILLISIRQAGTLTLQSRSDIYGSSNISRRLFLVSRQTVSSV